MDPLAPSQARQAIRQVLSSWRVADGLLHDDLLLLTSELVTNAVRHGDGRITLRVTMSGVIDRGLGRGRLRTATDALSLAHRQRLRGGRTRSHDRLRVGE